MVQTCQLSTKSSLGQIYFNLAHLMNEIFYLKRNRIEKRI